MHGKKLHPPREMCTKISPACFPQSRWVSRERVLSQHSIKIRRRIFKNLLYNWLPRSTRWRRWFGPEKAFKAAEELIRTPPDTECVKMTVITRGDSTRDAHEAELTSFVRSWPERARAPTAVYDFGDGAGSLHHRPPPFFNNG